MPEENFLENGIQTTVSLYQRFEYDKACYQNAAYISAANGERLTQTDPDELGRIIRTTTYRDQGRTKYALTETYYNENGNKKTVVDANNTALPREQQKVSAFTYSAMDLLLTETDPAGNKTSYTYDVSGNRASMTDPRGNSGKYSSDFTIVYHYDDLNRLIQGDLPKSGNDTTKPVIKLAYDPRGNLISREEPDHGLTTYTYWPRNLVNTVTTSGDGPSITVVHHYDESGNEDWVTDSRGFKTEKNYDALNRVTEIDYPAPNPKTGQNTIEYFDYDENNNRTSYINGNSYGTEYNYNRYNKLTQVVNAKGDTTSYNYDRFGNMTRMIDPMNRQTNYDYDELNRLIKQTNPDGSLAQYDYDRVGNRKWSKDPNGAESQYEYYPNNLVSRIQLTNGGKTETLQYDYDEAGYRKSTQNNNVVTAYNTDGNGYNPDPFGRVRRETKTLDSRAFATGYDYDVMGRVTGISYPTGQTVNYQYNNLGQLLKVPGYIDTNPVYDQGFLKEYQAANGVKTNMEYDPNGRLLSLKYTDPASAVLKQYAYSYDGANNIIQKNEDTFQYDALNQLLFANLKGKFEINPYEETQQAGKIADDYDGQTPLEFTLSQLDIIELDYAAGSIGVDLQSPVKVTRLHLTPQSPVNRVAADNLAVYGSDNNSNFTKIDGWKLVQKEKGVLEIVFDNPVTTRYIKVKSYYDDRDNQFEAVNKATFANIPDELIKIYYLVDMRQEQYVYDKNGNRTTASITESHTIQTNYTYYPNTDRLKSNDKYTFEYDANGNLTKKTSLGKDATVWTYEYDLPNHLIQVTKNDSVVATYVYDESGLRLKKTGSQGTTYYSFDLNGNVLSEQTGNTYLDYVYVLGKHFARVDGNSSTGVTKKYFYQTDNLGSTVLVTDEEGKQVYSSEYTPFGKQVGVDGELDHVTQFTGKDLDEDTGLYYFNARWYDEDTGRFVTEDPDEDPNNPNLYAYCQNNPLTITDPTGLISQEDAIKLNKLFTSTPERNAPPQYIQKIVNENVEGHGYENAVNYGMGLYDIQSEHHSSLTEYKYTNTNLFTKLFKENVKFPEVVQLEKETGITRYDTAAYSINELEYKLNKSGSNVAAENFFISNQRVNEIAEFATYTTAGRVISNQGRLPNNPEGEFTKFNFSGKGTVKATPKLTNGMKMKTNNALDAASDYLGKGYKDMGNGRYVSADGTKQVRFTDSDLTPTNNHAGAPHMNFEVLVPNPSKPGKMMPDPKQNIHVFLED